MMSPKSTDTHCEPFVANGQRIRLDTVALQTICILFAVICPIQVNAQDLELLEEAAFKQATAVVEPSIVRIETVGGVDRVGKMLTSSAPTTGVIVSEDGDVISSAFNFISKPSSILIQLPDGRRFPAKLVATDRVRMLTLLKIQADDLKPIPPADQSTVKVGHWGLALGRTYDLENPSVSVGVISALNRVWGKAVQTDAKVSPVNYGGPLISIEGKAIGVLVPLSPQADGETAGVEWYDSGIGFAIPMQDAYRSAEKLKEGKDLKRGFLGVTLRGRDLYAKDVILDRVRFDSPAEKAGFKPEDIIVEVDGKPVERQAQVRHVLWSRYAGDEVEVTVKRGEETLTERLKLVAELKPYESGFLGILPHRDSEDGETIDGVKVRHVFAESPAAVAGIEIGDVIVGFNETGITDSASLLDVVSRIRPEESVSVSFKRGDEAKKADIKVTVLNEEIAGELKEVLIPPPNVDFGDDDKKKEDKDKKETSEDSKKSNEDSTEDSGTDDSEKAAADLPKTGRYTEKLEAHKHNFWAYVPDDYNPAWSYSLMVCIHPPGDTMEAMIIESWKAICDRRGIILVGPKAANISGFNPNEAEFVTDCTKLMMDRYNVDAARVALHGYAKGGDFCWQLAFKNRELFKGIQTIASGLVQPPPENRPEFRQQIHMICGDKDRVARLVKLTLNGLKKMKYPVTYTELPMIDQEREYPADETLEEAARWIDSLDRI